MRFARGTSSSSGSSDGGVRRAGRGRRRWGRVASRMALPGIATKVGLSPAAKVRKPVAAAARCVAASPVDVTCRLCVL